MNKTLQFLTLMKPKMYENPSYEEEVADQRWIQKYHQGERIRSEFQSGLALAFLSIVQHESSIDSARQALDSFMVARMLRFADNGLRRILWKNSAKVIGRSHPWFSNWHLHMHERMRGNTRLRV